MEATLEITPISSVSPHDPRYLQKLSVQKRKDNKIAAELREKELELVRLAKLVALQPIVQNPFHKVIIEQIEDIDARMQDADDKALASLADAKAKLWKLLFPQPKASRSRRDFTPAEPDNPGQ